MKQVLGMFVLLLVVGLVTTLIQPRFVGTENLTNLISRSSLVAIMAIGVSFVIITGGIDLSIGSLVALVGVLLPMFLTVNLTMDNRVDVSELNTADSTVIVSQLPGEVKPGRKLFFSGGYSVADRVFTVEGVDGNTLRISPQPPVDDTQGSLVPLYGIAGIDRDARTLEIEGDLDYLGREDRLGVFKAGSDQQLRYTVQAADYAAETGRTALRLTQSLDSGLEGGMVMPIRTKHMNVPLAVSLVLLIAGGIGLVHGLLITKLKIQPFIVTLCGLLIYRGLARFIAEDKQMGFGDFFSGLRYLAQGKPLSIPVPFLDYIAEGRWGTTKVDPTTGEQVLANGDPVQLDLISWVAIPMPTLIVVGIAIVAWFFLNRTIYGRYLFALGNNEQAARFSGINTDRMIIFTYVFSSLMAGVAGILYVLLLNNTQPSSSGAFFELYAIAAAVLGGCSLRGGEGSVIGVLIGATIMQVLYNAINMTGIPTQLEYTIIGLVLLFGVMGDEVFRRISAKRRRKQIDLDITEEEAAADRNEESPPPPPS